MLKWIWLALWPLARRMDNGWLRDHPNAEIVSERLTARGTERTVRCGNEQRVYLQDDNGNVVEVHT